jgi:CheY-like chemotaxis protein
VAAKVLVVDDEPQILTALARGLQRVGHEVIVARNGEDALDFLFSRGDHEGRPKERKPRLIILDISLPGINGFGVVRQLRTHPDYRHTPVVILTTSDEQSDILQSYDLGANSYLCKPVDFESFADILEQVSQYWLETNSTPH